MIMKEFELRFLCADEIEYEGSCVYLAVPMSDGSYGIMADHANMVAVMPEGELKINTGKEMLRYAISGGLLQIRSGKVLILSYSAERPEDIDEKRAEEAADRARIKMNKRSSELEYKQAQADLPRALNRLKIKHKV